MPRGWGSAADHRGAAQNHVSPGSTMPWTCLGEFSFATRRCFVSTLCRTASQESWWLGKWVFRRRLFLIICSWPRLGWVPRMGLALYALPGKGTVRMVSGVDGHSSFQYKPGIGYCAVLTSTGVNLRAQRCLDSKILGSALLTEATEMASCAQCWWHSARTPGHKELQTSLSCW